MMIFLGAKERMWKLTPKEVNRGKLSLLERSGSMALPKLEWNTTMTSQKWGPTQNPPGLGAHQEPAGACMAILGICPDSSFPRGDVQNVP